MGVAGELVSHPHLVAVLAHVRGTRVADGVERVSPRRLHGRALRHASFRQREERVVRQLGRWEGDELPFERVADLV